jgi:hypothetical protein
MNRLKATLLIPLATAALFAGPISVSATPAPDYGAVAKCHYKITASGKFGWTQALLKTIAVTPPTIYAESGTQQVGWRYVVRRSLHRDSGPWKVTYRSPIQKESATTSSAAAFHTMRVQVSVPEVEYQDDVHYTVSLTLFWYNADGSAQSKVGHPMSSMHLIVGHEDNGGDDDFCPGLAQQFFD